MNKPTIMHLIAAVLFSGGQAIQFFKVNPDIASQAHVTASVLTVASFVIALASTQLFGTPTPPAPTSPAPAAKAVTS